VKAQCMRMIAGLKLSSSGSSLLSGFVDRYLNLSPVEKTEFESEVGTFGPQEKERIMQITTSWKEEGREEGLKEGREEGAKEGRKEGRVDQARAILLRIGTKRLGKPTAAVKSRIAALSAPSQLDRMIDAALDADSWESVLSCK